MVEVCQSESHQDRRRCKLIVAESGSHIPADSQYDQIFRDIEPYFALSPEMFQERAAALVDTAHS